MVATLYSYGPVAAEKNIFDGIYGVISNQDTGDAASVRTANAEAQVQTLFNVPDGYLEEKSVLGLPTGGVLSDADDTRIYLPNAPFVEVQGP